MISAVQKDTLGHRDQYGLGFVPTRAIGNGALIPPPWSLPTCQRPGRHTEAEEDRRHLEKLRSTGRPGHACNRDSPSLTKHSKSMTKKQWEASLDFYLFVLYLRHNG